ncbi:MAG: DEAD/DEAH box helicase [Patescibacteria group bacterium]|nr:DEAD/DEAH box helicase [Patescibacteria group bacterium]
MQDLPLPKTPDAAGYASAAHTGALLLGAARPASKDVARWAHQQEEIEKHWAAPARALLWPPRSGKTRAIADHLQRLEAERGVTRTLIIAPQFVCKTVWPEELERIGRSALDLSSGPLVQRKTRLTWMRQSKPSPGIHAIVLVNWDALARLVPEILAWGPQLVIADEAHYAKAAGAARSRAYHRICAQAQYRRALTGTPTPRDYIDAYSIWKGLDPSIFGTSKAAFERRYCELDPWGRPKFYRNLPELQTKMHSISSVFDRAKAWRDMPPQIVSRRLALPPDVRALYDDLVKKTVAEWEGVEIDATHKLARITKLQELTAGFITNEQGEPVWVHETKIEAAVSECVDLVNAREQVVVFYHFTPEGKRLEERLIEEVGRDAVARVGGDVSVATRVDLQKRFNGRGTPRIMVMQDSLGIGISLKAASYLVRMSYPLDYAAYLQSNERIYEPGKPLTYVTLDVERSVDQFARRVCMDKKRASDELLGLGFEGVALGLAA